jgi:ABC-type glycerol-3-phosphate transport system permease component
MELTLRTEWLKSSRRQRRLGNLAAYIILGVVAVTMFLPFLWMISTAFKPAQETFAYPPTFIPQNFTLDNFREAWAAAPFGLYYLNSFRVAITVTLAQIFFCSLAGYIFAKLQFWGRDVLFLLVVAKLMIPIQVLIVPLYLLIIRLSLADTLTGVILPDLIGAFGIFMLRQFIETLPSELIDSARLDGCSEFGIYWRIILPLIVPALAVFAIITFIDTWNDFLWPLIVISSPARRTLPLGLAVFADEYVVQNNLAMAAAIIVLVPVLVVFAIFQRRIIDSVALSGLKEG